MSTKLGQSKSIRVAPNVTDPTMRNNRGPAELMLDSEMGVDRTSDHADVFDKSPKTKEELEAAAQEEPAPTSTVLIIVFALIVVALVSLIVWMLMKQSNDTKDEEEMRRVIQPHPRNNMPPNYAQHQQHLDNSHLSKHPSQPNMQQFAPADVESHQRNMALMHQQQQALQQQMAQMQQAAPKTNISAECKVTSAAPTTAADVVKPQAPKPAESDVDDILRKTQDLLNPAVKPAELSPVDEQMLNAVNNNAESDDDDETDE